MSTPINTPSALATAQAATYFKGQANQSEQSDEKKEQERKLTQMLQQAKKHQQTQNQAAEAQKGFLA